MGGCGVNHCSGCGISGSTVFDWASRRMTMYDVFSRKALHWASRRMTMYDVGSNKASRNICIPRQQGQRRYLIYASRSSREGVANACIWSTTRPKANRLRTTHATRDGPCGHVFATILGREPRVAAGPLSGQVKPGSPHSPSRRNAGLEDVRGD